jgi:hypothetical protein
MLPGLALAAIKRGIHGEMPFIGVTSVGVPGSGSATLCPEMWPLALFRQAQRSYDPSRSEAQRHALG